MSVPVSPDFSTRLTAAVAHAPPSGGLTTIQNDLVTLINDINSLIAPVNIAVQLGFEGMLLGVATYVASELRPRG